MSRTRARRSPTPAGAPLLEEWVMHLAAKNRSPRTIRGYRNDLMQFSDWLRKPLESATAADLHAFSHAMHRAELAAVTRLRRLVALRQFYGYLLATERLAESPAARLDLPEVAEEREPEFLLPEEVGDVRGAFPSDPRGLRDRALFELGLSSLRVFEVVGLRLDDLILLRQAQVRVRGKGGGTYQQSITPDAVAAVQAWLVTRPACPAPYVFIPLPPRGARGLHQRTADRAITRYYRAAGIVRTFPRPFHALRHTAGKTMGNAGVPLQYIQDFMRHKNPRTTRIYARVDAETLREVARRELRFPTTGRKRSER